MQNGLIDADLGGFLYKKRVARPDGGKSGGYQTVLSARIGDRYVFLHGATKPTSRRMRGRRCSSPARCLWEQGDTRPAGPALKLLNVIADKGLEAVL